MNNHPDYTPKVPTPTREQKVLIHQFMNEEKAKDRAARAAKKALRTMPKPQRSTAIQRLQPALPAVRSRWHQRTAADAAHTRRKDKPFESMVSRLCEMGSQRSRAATAGEGVR